MDAKMTIPVMHCFDDRYTAPAAVAFLSMLEHADKNYFYKLYVVHSDITEQHQRMLQEVVGRFPNASLVFLSPHNRIDQLFFKVATQEHFSKEVLLKLTVADEFPELSRLMIVDVDCLYLDDVSKIYVDFIKDDNYVYGYNSDRFGVKWLSDFNERTYGNGFDSEEQNVVKRGVGGGFLVFNLEAMRRDGIVKKMEDFLVRNAKRIKQMEQDVINFVCAERLSYMPQRALICTYLWSVLTEDEKPAWAEAMAHPIQLHFPGPFKPWIEPGGVKADLWWGYLARTPFFFEVASQFSLKPRKSTYSFFGKIPFVEIWSRGEVTKVRFARFFNLRKSIPFWRKKK